MKGRSFSTTVVKTGYERPNSERQRASRSGASRDQMCSVERARKAVTEKSDDGDGGEDFDGAELGLRLDLGFEEADEEAT